MKLNDLIKKLQKINEKHKNPEVAFRDNNNWRQHKKALKVNEEGVIEVVDAGNETYIPTEIIDAPRGFTEEFNERLKRLEKKKVLLLFVG